MSLKNRTREAIMGYVFILPNVVLFLVFLAFPVVSSLFISLADWNLINPPEFIGIHNYIQLFSDSFFWKCMRNTAVFSLFSVGLGVFFSLFLATILDNPRLRAAGFFKSAIFLPVIFSSVSIAVVWQWILDNQSGILNYCLRLVGLKSVPWIVSTKWALSSVIGVAVWKQAGYNMVIFLAALKGVPQELYEAAEIDGARPMRKFWKITWPLISPSTFFVLVTSIIGSFQIFDLTTVLTNGGPAYSTNTLIMMVYQYGFQFFKMGYASAMAYVLFAIILILTAVQALVSKKWVYS
jgi:multiple sugar transport system permease protein